MTDHFDKAYWETHWDRLHRAASRLPAHPALEDETAGLRPGTALEAGSGEGAEASWLATRGWKVTAVDISTRALAQAATQPVPNTTLGSVTWVEADLTDWAPSQQFDLVTTFYAHPAMPQHAFYERIAQWVAPGGSLLIVGHHDNHGHGQPSAHPQNAVTAPEQIRALFNPAEWVVHTAEVRERVVTRGSDHCIVLRDVIARVERV